MSDSAKKVFLAFFKSLIPLVASLLGGLISVYLGDGSAVPVAIGSALGGIAYSAC